MTPVDLRSDTVTKPTRAMREAIANAEVGDDVLGADPTTAELERRVAELLGQEAAAFFPSGTMANETALCVLAPRGTEVVVEARSHFVDWELGGAAAIAGVQLRGVPTARGVLDVDDIEAAIRPAMKHQLRTAALAVENTHNGAGGTVVPVERMQALRDVARRHDLPLHLDGARLWNAAAASGRAERDWAALADTVMVSLSKGLGCPVGSILAGSAERIDEARMIRKRLGGGMRQSGILAAAGLYALDHHRERLVQDHERARTLAREAAGIDGLDVVQPETNIVMMDIVRDDIDAPTIVAALAERGVLMVPFTKRRVRAVTHLDVDDAGIERAVGVLRQAMDKARG